jgi:ABC-type transporter Mla subunit MlaD
MTEPSRPPDSNPDTSRRWLRVVVIVAIIAILLVVVMLLSGGGGGHGPSRHI